MAIKAHSTKEARYALVGMSDSRLPKLYCRPADGVLDCEGPLSGTIAPNILAEVNKEVKLATAGQKKKARVVSLLHRQGEGASSPVQQCNGDRAAV